MAVTKEQRKAQNKRAYQRWVVAHPGYKTWYRSTTLEKAKEQERLRRHRYHDAAIAFLGSRCANPKCRYLNEHGSLGCTDVRLLQIDHPKNDGYKERLSHSQMSIYKKILSSQPGEYRLLCASCNWLHRFEDF